MQTATNGHKTVTVRTLANSLKIEPAQAISLLSQLGVKADSPESPVPHAIASQLMQVEADIASYTSPRLVGEAKSQEREANEQPTEEVPPSSLTLSDAKTIAQVNNVSIDLVQGMVDLMQEKYEKLLLQQGYYQQKKEDAIVNLGKSLAQMEAYREKLTSIQKAQNEIRDFDGVAFLKAQGIDIEAVLKAQSEFDQTFVEGEDSTPFEAMLGNLGKLA